MSIKLVRKTNDQTSQDKYIVTNVDDTRMIRYAYNGYSGYVKGVGNELKYSYNDTTFTIDTGLIVIDGWEIYIAEGGESIDLGYLSGYAAHSIYVEINANTEVAVIKVISAPVTDASKDFPAIDKGNDLTVASAGTARLLLYNVLCQSGVILEDTIIKQVREIPRLDTLLEEDRLTFKKATDSKNVTSQINGHNISDIFEANGKTVKNATSVNNLLNIPVSNSFEAVTYTDNNNNVISTANALGSKTLKNLIVYSGPYIAKDENTNTTTTHNNKVQIGEPGIYIVTYKQFGNAEHFETSLIIVSNLEIRAYGLTTAGESYIEYQTGSHLIATRNANNVNIKAYLIAKL